MKPSLLLLLLSFAVSAFAGGENPLSGGKAAGMSNASVTFSDVWSTNHNQAGLAFLTKPIAGIYSENRFFIQELSLQVGAIALPLKAGIFGLSFSYFGFSLYNENKIGLAYAMKFGEKLSAGIQLDYMTVCIAEGYGNKSLFAAEVGIMARLSDELTLGAHLFNPTQSLISTITNERSQTIFRLGLDYSFTNKAIVAVETLKNSNSKPEIKIGLQYAIVNQIYLRTGISTNPSLNSFGLGVNLNKIDLDLASTFHQQLGYSSKLSLSYKI